MSIYPKHNYLRQNYPRQCHTPKLTIPVKTLLMTILTLTLLGCYSTPDFKVGSQRFTVSNDNISEQVSPALKDILDTEYQGTRQLMIKIWYPSENELDEDSRKHYLYHTESHPIAINPVHEDRLALVSSNPILSDTYQYAPPQTNNKPYPVLLYSHGKLGTVENNETYFEYLTQRGFIVVSIGHTGLADIVTIDSRIESPNSLFIEDLNRTIPFEDRDQKLSFGPGEENHMFNMPLGSDVPEFLIEKFHYNEAKIKLGYQEHLNLWVADYHYVVDQLEKIHHGQIESNLKGIFDLQRIGATGHSFGGAASRRFCNEESRCLASINLDGGSFSLFEEKIMKPHLELWHDVEADIQEQIRMGVLPPSDPFAIEQERASQILYGKNHKHANIYAAKDELYLLSLDSISHLDFTLGFVDIHDYGLGKNTWHPFINKLSYLFFERFINRKPLAFAQCIFMSTQDFVNVGYASDC